MPVTGTLGARLYTVNSTPLVDIEGSADQIEDFKILPINIEVGLIESFSELGKIFDVVSLSSYQTGRTYKFKNNYNNGTIQLIVGHDLGDQGQFLLKSFANGRDDFTYPFKIGLTGADENFNKIWFGAKVVGFRTQMGNVGSVMKSMVTLEINTEIFFGTEVVNYMNLVADPLLLGTDHLFI